MKTILTALLLFCLFTPAWAGAQKGQAIKTTGTIRHQGIEGGFWGIVGDDGKNYDPTNLAPEFQQDGLKVSFEAVPATNQMSIHMWGTIVEIKSMQKSGGEGKSAQDSSQAAIGIVRRGLTVTWEAAKRVLAARGDTLLVRDETTETIATKPHALERDALLASIKSQFKPEESGYANGTYELAINLTPKDKARTTVEVKAKLMAFGTPNKAMARPSGWDSVASNGNIEKKVLKAILKEAEKKRR